MIKRLNFPGLHDFILPTLDTIIAVVLPMSVIVSSKSFSLKFIFQTTEKFIKS